MPAMKTDLQKLNPQIREAAVDWLLAFCESEVDAAGRQAFNAWLRTSPEHVRAYLRVSAVWAEAGRIDQARKRSVDGLVQQALAASNVVQFAPGERNIDAPRASRNVKPGFPIAASLLLGILGVFSGLQYLKAPTYSTQIGEQRLVTLSDGSRVELNADSSIRVRYSADQRLVELTAGQALFSVAKNPRRPFIVRTGDTDVKAVGTQFDVYRKASQTVVTVLEGRVAVAGREQVSAILSSSNAPAEPVLLSAGEQAVVRPSATIAAQPANVNAAVAWTEGLLMFESTPLREVVHEFNRHNLKPLVIEDEALQSLEISGVFPATGAKSVLSFLQQRFGIEVRETDTDIRIARP